jgi:hypothetical protein
MIGKVNNMGGRKKQIGWEPNIINGSISGGISTRAVLISFCFKAAALFPRQGLEKGT